MFIRIQAVLLIVAAGAASAVGAAEAPLFDDDAILKAVLTAPISQAFAQKNQEARLYLPGQWTYIDEDGQTARLDVSIRARGDFRLMLCERTPLQLNFKKKQVKGTLFAGQNKLKVVAPCMQQTDYQRYVLLEYLAYRSLQVLTDYSFRTRLIRLSYIDSDDRLDPWTALVFVIEDDADMARRLGLVRVDVESVGFADLEREKTALVEVFQFLIGNNDYSVLRGDDDGKCCHNTEVVAVDETSPKIPVPFDFDFSGLVDAPYAAPPQHLPIREVRHRYYTGLCHPPGMLEAAIEHVVSRRDALYGLIDSLDELDDRGRRTATFYFDSFFRLIDNPKRLEREILDRCRGRHILEAMLEEASGPVS